MHSILWLHQSELLSPCSFSILTRVLINQQVRHHFHRQDYYLVYFHFDWQRDIVYSETTIYMGFVIIGYGRKDPLLMFGERIKTSFKIG